MQQRHNLLDCSFLQVTINSHKLMQIIEKLTKQISEHTAQIKILRQVIPTIKQSVFSSLQTAQARMKLEGQKSVLKTKQEINLINAHLQCYDSQIGKMSINFEKKFKEKDDQVQFLEQEKKRIQGIINIYEQNRMEAQGKIGQDIWDLRDRIEKLEKQIAMSDSKTDDKFQMILVKIQSILRKNNSHSRIRQDFSDMPHKKQRNSSVLPKFAPKGKQGKASGSNYSNWASFSTKISQFDKKIQEMEENPPYINKILYGKKNSAQQADSQGNIGSDYVQSENLNLCQKSNIENYNSLLNIYNNENQKSIQSLKNKLVIQQQKLAISLRKIQKILQTQGQFKMNLQKITEKRSDEQYLQILRNQIKKNHIEVSEQLDKKLYKQIFQKQKNKILQKISILQQNLTQKADKGDMKKAFMFMQQKIKQIIILIASDQNQQKNGAIRKIQAKCLSCDKGFETQNVTPNTDRNGSRLASPLTSRENDVQLRTITRKIRSRIQANNQNSSINL